MKNWWLIASSLVSIPLAYADLGSSVTSIWNKILFVGSFGFLNVTNTSAIVALTRILIWIATFTIFFALIMGLNAGKKGVFTFFNRSQALVVAGVLATLTAIFTPVEVLLATGAGWATLVAFVFIGAPVVGIAYLLWKIPWEGEETKWTVFLKIFLCLRLTI